MNTRSLRFRLIVWYAGLLVGCFVLRGATAYFSLDSYLTRALRESLQRRGRQIEQLFVQQARQQHPDNIGVEGESRYWPCVNDRLCRIASQDGKIVFQSSAPPSHKFFPDTIPAPVFPARLDSSSKLQLASGRQVLIARHVAQLPDGVKYLIETGAPLDEVQADLRQWLILLLVG